MSIRAALLPEEGEPLVHKNLTIWAEALDAHARNASAMGGRAAVYTLGTAAVSAGLAKSTVLRAIKGGRLSAQRDSNGQWTIDPAEFHRVFPPLPIADGAAALTAATADALVAELRAVIADLRQDRDHWRLAHEREQAAHAATQRLLPAPTLTAAPADATVAPAARRLWWPWRRAG